MKKIVSLALALVLIVGALLVLGLAIDSTLGTIFNLYRAIRYSGISLKAIHNWYCPAGAGVGSNYDILHYNVIYGCNVFKLPFICIIANNIFGIANLVCPYAFALTLACFAIMLISPNKIKKFAKLLPAFSLAIFGVTQLVMGFVESCAWIRVALSIFRMIITLLKNKFRGFLDFFQLLCQSGNFNIYSVIYYVVALFAFVLAIYLIVGDKKAVKAPVANEVAPATTEPEAEEAPTADAASTAEA